MCNRIGTEVRCVTKLKLLQKSIILIIIFHCEINANMTQYMHQSNTI